MNWDEHQATQERRHDTPCSGADPEASDEPQTVLAWLLCSPTGGRQAVLRRHGVGSSRALCSAPAKPSVTSFKHYAPRFARVDVKDLPPMADEDTRRYRFVATDRTTRWAYMAIKPDESARAFEAFPAALAKALPFRIADLLRTLHFRSRGDLKHTLCRSTTSTCPSSGAGRPHANPGASELVRLIP